MTLWEGVYDGAKSRVGGAVFRCTSCATPVALACCQAICPSGVAVRYPGAMLLPIRYVPVTSPLTGDDAQVSRTCNLGHDCPSKEKNYYL
jgi:hypothetical protein